MADKGSSGDAATGSSSSAESANEILRLLEMSSDKYPITFTNMAAGDFLQELRQSAIKILNKFESRATLQFGGGMSHLTPEQIQEQMRQDTGNPSLQITGTTYCCDVAGCGKRFAEPGKLECWKCQVCGHMHDSCKDDVTHALFVFYCTQCYSAGCTRV